MTDRRRNALIGLFVLGGLIALGVLIVKFGESRGLFSKRYILTAKFERVTSLGIREGTDIYLSGVWVGSVLRIELVNRLDPSAGMFVRMEIGEEFRIPRGSEANIFTPIMGQPVINIIPIAAAELLPPDGTAEIHGMVKNPLEQIIDPEFMATLEKSTEQIGTLAEAMTPAAKAITDLLKKRPISEVEAPEAAAQDITANLYTAVERLHNVLKHFDTVLGDPEVQSNLKETLANLKTASEEAKLAAAGFRKFSEQANETALKANTVVGKLDTTIEATYKRVDELSKKLIDNSDKLSELLDKFITIGRDMTEGEGTMAMLLRDPKFYEALLLTTERLGDAASELKILIKQWQEKGLLQ